MPSDPASMWLATQDVPGVQRTLSHATEPDPQLKPSGTRSEQDDVLGRKEMSAKACVSQMDPNVAATPLRWRWP